MSLAEFASGPGRQSVAVSAQSVDRYLAIGVVGLAGCGVLIELVHYFTGDDSQFGLYPIFSLEHSHNLPTWYLAGLFALCALVSAVLATTSGGHAVEKLRCSGAALVFGIACLAVFTELASIAAHIWAQLYFGDGFDRMLLLHPITAALAIALSSAVAGLIIPSVILCLMAWPRSSRSIRMLSLVAMAALAAAATGQLVLVTMLQQADGTIAGELLRPMAAVARNSFAILGASAMLAALLRVVCARRLELTLASGAGS